MRRSILPFLPLLSYFVLVSSLTGCRSSAPPSSAAATTSVRPARTEEPDIQSDPDYARVKSLYAAGKRTEAAAQIDRLLARPGLSDANRKFLGRQKVLCLTSTETHGKATATPAAGPHSGDKLPASFDCGPRALLAVCEKLGVKSTLPDLIKASNCNRYGSTLEGLRKAAEGVGLRAKGEQRNLAALGELQFKAIAWVDGSHYVALMEVSGGRAVVRDPGKDEDETWNLETLLQRSGGLLLTLRK